MNTKKSTLLPVEEVSPGQEVIKNPHDALFKSMCENINVTIDLLKSALPADLFNKIKLDTLQLTDKSFVLPEMAQRHSDIIYQAEINHHEGYIAFLIEHQSSDDALMAFRKLEYNVSLMRQHLKQEKLKLPVIINLCLYHGERSPYPYSTDLFDCFSDPILAKQWMFQPFQLIDLTVMTDEEIEKHGYAALMQFLFKHCRDAELSRKVKQMVALLRRLDADLHLQNVLYYLTEVCGDRDDAERLLRALMNQLSEKEETIMTYGEQLRQAGRQVGQQEGRQEGRQEVALDMLLAGFDPDIIQKVTKISPEIIFDLKQKMKH